MGCGCGKNKKKKVNAKKSMGSGLYFKKNSKSCPKCGTSLVSVHSFNQSTNKISVVTKCNNCGYNK